MLNNRGNIELDAMLKSSFFTLPAEDNFSLRAENLGFSLPTSAEELGAFFGSEEGEKFKRGFAKFIDEIDVWAKEYEIKCVFQSNRTAIPV